jgi:hypothetical protein
MRLVPYIISVVYVFGTSTITLVLSRCGLKIYSKHKLFFSFTQDPGDTLHPSLPVSSTPQVHYIQFFNFINKGLYSYMIVMPATVGTPVTVGTSSTARMPVTAQQ